jgi:hypothetical protein
MYSEKALAKGLRINVVTPSLRDSVTNRGISFPTLKRGASQLCASGALVWRLFTYSSIKAKGYRLKAKS